MKLLVIDNYDSFTYMLVDYLHQAGARCRVVRNDAPLDSVLIEPADAVVLSPGPGTPDSANNLMPIIRQLHRQLPMLGICLGHQALGQFFGAELTRAAQPMHGKLSAVNVLAADPLTNGLPDRFTVTRYHSLLVRALPPSLVSLAETDAGEVMMLRHRRLPLWGIQFHPEAALTQFGIQMLKNWINFVGRNAL